MDNFGVIHTIAQALNLFRNGTIHTYFDLLITLFL